MFLTKGSDHADGLVKRLKYKNGEYVLESDNKEYGDLRIGNSDITAYGKVIQIINNTTKRRKDPLMSYIDKLDMNEREMIESMLKGLVEKKKETK